MENQRIIRKFALTPTLRAMKVGDTLFLANKTVQPEVVYQACQRLKRLGQGLYEVHRSAGDSTITRLL